MEMSDFSNQRRLVINSNQFEVECVENEILNCNYNLKGLVTEITVEGISCEMQLKFEMPVYDTEWDFIEKYDQYVNNRKLIGLDKIWFDLNIDGTFKSKCHNLLPTGILKEHDIMDWCDEKMAQEIRALDSDIIFLASNRIESNMQLCSKHFVCGKKYTIGYKNINIVCTDSNNDEFYRYAF